MGRRTVYNKLTEVDSIDTISKKNRELLLAFLDYCTINNKAPQTVKQYKAQLLVFFVWNKEHNGDKFFVNLRKRELIEFFAYGRLQLKWSPNRLASFKAVLSSLSMYIERVYDEEYPTFRNLIPSLGPITITQVREKTVLGKEEVEQTLYVLVRMGKIQEACWFALLYSSGMRKSEVAQMQVDFFVPENTICDIMYKTPPIRTKGRGEEGKVVPRYVFIYTFQPYLEKWLKKREELGITNKELFVVKRNGEWVPAKISTFNSWASFIGTIMGKDFYCHSLRHAWTTELKRGGYPSSIIQKLQNWASADMVEVYSDIGGEEEIENFFTQMKKEKELKEDNGDN